MLPYRLGFTAASLRPELARLIAERYLITRDWATTRASVLADNALQSKAPSSAVRVERELRQRLQTLTDGQLRLLAESTSEDRSAMAWLAALKYNVMPYEFAVEVLRDKLAIQDAVLRPSDYEAFIESRLPAHPELAELTPATRVKIRRVLLRMLFEAGLLLPKPSLGTVQRAVLSPDAQRAIVVDERRWLAGFLFSEEEIAAA